MARYREWIHFRWLGPYASHVVAVWFSPALIVGILVTACAEMLIRLPFSGLQIIPGHLDFFPGIAIVPVAGILLGPAGAWGVLLGSLAGDALVDQWHLLSWFRALALFFFALTSDRLWRRFHVGPVGGAKRGATFGFVFISWAGCLIAAAWRGLGSELLRMYPFVYVMPIALLNNLLFATLLGAPLFAVLRRQKVFRKRTWADILGVEAEDVSVRDMFFMVVSGVGACAAGLYASRLFYHVRAFTPFTLGTSTGWLVPFVVLPFLLLGVVAMFRRR